MTDWCLVECHQEVMYGSADNIVHWHNVPLLVILNVPDEIALGEPELLQFLARPDVYGMDHRRYREIAGAGLNGSPPIYGLVKLGGEMPDDEMRTHIFQDHESGFEVAVFDWLTDNQSDSENRYYPWVRNGYDFYKRYDVTPHSGWKWWERAYAENEANRKPASV